MFDLDIVLANNNCPIEYQYDVVEEIDGVLVVVKRPVKR